MNQIVTSAKLGEYLAAGLPVITTGANAEILNDFIRRREAGVFVADSLEVTTAFLQELEALLVRSRDNGWRERLSRAIREAFAGPKDPLQAYVRFMCSIAEQLTGLS
jgi:glycosyltransferase involved in cell wall biosynthesis